MGQGSKSTRSNIRSGGFAMQGGKFLPAFLILFLLCTFGEGGLGATGLAEALQEAPASVALAPSLADSPTRPVGAAGMLASNRLSQPPPTPTSPPAQESPPTVYLTFDDGPSPLTDQVLQILQRNKIKATFFVVGDQVERYPNRLRNIVKAGHTVGNHSYNHIYKELYGSFENFALQITKTEKIIQEAAGVNTRLVRAPGGTFGNFDQLYFDALAGSGYVICDWNVDSGDSARRNVPAAEILKNVKQSKRTRKMIVLMHDGSGHNGTIQALPGIIAYFKQHGYQFGMINEAMKPPVFRVAPDVKWKRDDPSLEHAVALLGNAPNAAPQATAPSESAEQGKLLVPLDELDQSQVLLNGMPFVPLRIWVERSGGQIDWDAAKEQVLIHLDGQTITIQAAEGSLTYTDQANVEHQQKVSLVRKNGSLLLPSEELRQALTLDGAQGLE